MRPLIPAVAAQTCILIACGPATPELTEVQRDEIAAEVDLRQAQLWDALEAADWDRIKSYVYGSPETAWGYEGGVVFGWDAMNSTFGPAFEVVESQNAMLTESRTTVVSPNVVHVFDTGVLSGTDTAGVKGREEPFALSVLWVLREGEWKVLFGHESLATPYDR
jgi:ketosteroid isomerase-like protein